MRAEVTRILAYAILLTALPGQCAIVFGDFSFGIFWVLGANAIAGIAIGIRFPLFAGVDSGGQRPTRQQHAISLAAGGDMLKDCMVVIAEQLASFYVIVIVGAITMPQNFDPTLWFMPLLITLAGVIGLCVGLVAGMVVVTPIGALGGQLENLWKGRGASVFIVSVSTLLLAVAAIAITGTLAIHDSSDLHTRGEAFYQMFVVLTNLPSSTITIVSPTLAWVTRGLFVVVVLIAVVAAHSGTKRWGVRRAQKAQKTQKA